MIEFCNQKFRFHEIRLNVPADGVIEPLHCYVKGGEIKKGDIVVDAGAYIGMFTILASRIVGECGKVISFEPDRVNYRELIRNIELNGLRNVTPINKALWSSETIIPFNTKGNLNSAIDIENLASSDRDKVSAVRLDEELKRLGIEHVQFVKMDIEGAEIEALKGSERLLRNDHPTLAIATYHVINGEPTHNQVERLLREAGYDVETLHPEHLITYAVTSQS